MTIRTVRAAAALTVLALAAVGCGSSSNGNKLSSSTTPSTAAPAASAGGSATSSAASGGSNQALAGMVPAAIKSDGVITVGTDSTYAPSEFIGPDGKTIVGFDVDLFDAVAQKLGLKAQFQTADFGSIITGVNSGKYEAGVSSFTINKDREQHAEMISYFSAGTQWASQAGNPSGVQPDNACGHKVAVQKNTVQVQDIQARSKKCTQSGKKAITIDQYTGQDQATESVITGKDDAMLADSPVIAYAVQQTHGKLALLGPIYDSAPYGYVVKKGDMQFAQALQKALEAVMADGTYKKVLDKWGVGQGAINNPQVDPPASS